MNDVTCTKASQAIEHLYELIMQNEEAQAITTRNNLNLPLITALNGLLCDLHQKTCEVVS